MSQTVITTAFEAMKAQQAAAGTPVVLDEFVFANVPNLNITDPVDPAEALPTAAQIVHRAAVAKTGVVNENAVVYSVTLGADVGDFEFNWVGLINKASSTLAMIVHAPVQQKVKNASGTQGNVLTRSFLMEYDGAKKETQITTPAATWQIDFTARLAGMDERQRVENVDMYGDGAFFADSFLVTHTGNNYSIKAGTGYIGGLRTTLAADQALTVATKPVKVWVDASFTGTLTSAWQVTTAVTVADTLVNYVKNDVNHYVFAVALINADGSVTDLRPKGSKGEQQANNDFLRKDKNLSDVTDAEQARQHIGLGTAATHNVQTAKDDATASCVLVNGGTFAIGANQVAVHTGDMEFQFKGDGDFLSPGSVKAFNGVTELAQNAVYIRGTGNKHLWFYNPDGKEVGLVYASDDNVLHMRAAQGPSADVSADGNLTLTGADARFMSPNGLDINGHLHPNGSASASPVLLRAWGMSTGDRKTVFEVSDNTSWLYYAQRVASGLINLAVNGNLQAARIDASGPVVAGQNVNGTYFYTESNNGAGGFANQLDSGAPFYSQCGLRDANDNTYFPLVKGRTQLTTGYPTAVSFGLVTGGGTFPSAIIDVKGDNAEATFSFTVNGEIYVGSSSGSRPVAFQDWVNTRLGNVQSWANTDLRNDIYNWVRASFPTDTALGAQGSLILNGTVAMPVGCVMTGWGTEGSSPGGDTIYYRPIQKNVNGTWYTVGHSG